MKYHQGVDGRLGVVTAKRPRCLGPAAMLPQGHLLGLLHKYPPWLIILSSCTHFSPGLSGSTKQKKVCFLCYFTQLLQWCNRNWTILAKIGIKHTVCKWGNVAIESEYNLVFFLMFELKMWHWIILLIFVLKVCLKIKRLLYRSKYQPTLSSWCTVNCVLRRG